MRASYWVSQDKVQSYRTVFAVLVQHYGGQEEAAKEVGMTPGTLLRFKKGKLSSGTGRQILATYNKVRDSSGPD